MTLPFSQKNLRPSRLRICGLAYGPSGWLIALYIVVEIYGAIFKRNAGVAYLAHVAGFAAGAGIFALVLWKNKLEPARGEKTLLQVFGWIPENPEEVAPVRNPYLSTPNNAVRSASAIASKGPAAMAPPPRQEKPRDEGPIPLD